jgi:ABC-type Mn2+/Zn2+ transport system permease subunit
MELLKNPLVIGAIAAFISAITYIIYTKTNDKDNQIQVKSLLMFTVLGFGLSLLSTSMGSISDQSILSIDQDIMTGNPDF